MKINHPFLIENMRINLTKKYPCCLIPRKKIAEATGGILHPRTLANEDSLGKGIAHPILVKGNVCYGIDQILEYIVENTTGAIPEIRGEENSSNSFKRSGTHDR